MANKLTIEFSLTTGCSMSCRYCYSNHKPLYMNFKVADEFFEKVEILLKEYNCDSYHISYFGGEPTMNWKILEYTLPKFNNDPRCCSKCVITNGTLLTEERLIYLRENQCGISLSFDGIWSSKQRPLAQEIDGFTDSFELLMSKKHIYSSMVRGSKVMINARCFDTMTENFEFFVNEYGFSLPDFMLVRDNIYRKEHVEIYKKEIKRLGDKVIAYNHGYEHYSDFIEGKERDRTPKYYNVGFFRIYLLDTLINKKYGKRSHGCFVGQHGAVYTTEGEFYPCERFRTAKKMQLYSNKTGINRENIDFMKMPEVSDPRAFEDCKTCEIYEFCNAGCTYSQLLQGKWEKSAQIPNLCELFRITYSQAIRVFNECPQHYKDELLRELPN